MKIEINISYDLADKIKEYMFNNDVNLSDIITAALERLLEHHQLDSTQITTEKATQCRDSISTINKQPTYIQKMEELLEQGLTHREVAEELGYHRATVYKHFPVGGQTKVVYHPNILESFSQEDKISLIKEKDLKSSELVSMTKKCKK